MLFGRIKLRTIRLFGMTADMNLRLSEPTATLNLDVTQSIQRWRKFHLPASSRIFLMLPRMIRQRLGVRLDFRAPVQTIILDTINSTDLTRFLDPSERRL